MDLQRTALLAGVIVSSGWFAGWLAGIIIGSLWNESSSGAISLGIGWIAAGVITGVVLRQVIHSPWWPILSLGAGWPLMTNDLLGVLQATLVDCLLDALDDGPAPEPAPPSR